MTLIELFFALSVVGSAVVGLIAGWSQGFLCGVLGVILGPLIGFTAFVLLVWAPAFILAKTNPDADGRGTILQNSMAAIIFLGIVLSAPLGWTATIAATQFVSDWLLP